MTSQPLSDLNDDTLLERHEKLYRTSLMDKEWSNEGKSVSVGTLALGLVGGAAPGVIAGGFGAMALQAMDVINLPQFSSLLNSPLAVSVMAAGAVVGSLAGAYLIKEERTILQSFVDENKEALSQTTAEIATRPNLAERLEARRAQAEVDHAQMRATQAANQRDGVAVPLLVGALIGGPR